MSYRKSCFSTLGILVVAFSLLAASSGTAISQPQHCYALLSSISENSNSFSQVLETACFDTFSQAIDAATHGRVKLDPALRPQDITEDMLNPTEGKSMASTQIIIGVDWDSSYYYGNSFTWVANDYGCSPTIQYGVTSMPSGWDNRVSSARGFSNCNYFYHYPDASYGGTPAVCHTDCATMGNMDNTTSSERWTYNP